MAVVTLVAIVPATAGSAALPAVDGYPNYQDPGCLPRVEQPGVKEFRDLIRSRIGGGDSGIHACSGFEHGEGRAWDWTMSASNPNEAAKVQQVLDWLLRTDISGNPHAMARRFGIGYIIWNHQIITLWSGTSSRLWRPYTGSDPHTGHVHFSFGWPGARRETTWFTTAVKPPDWYPDVSPDFEPAGPTALRADFNADGRDDIAIFNQMSGSGLRLFIQYGGQSAPQMVWDAPTWGYPISNMRFVTGRFGFSSGTQIAAFLDYGNGRLGVWVFPGLNPGSPFLAIDAPTWGLSITSSKLVSGDLNNDALTDIAMFTDMGGNRLREHIIYGGQWDFGFRQVWDAPTWGYPITSLRFVTGHFGYGNGTDIAAFLDYGNGRLGVWVFPGYNPGSPFLAIDAPTWGVPIVRSKLTSGDLNNDSYTDIAVFTDMGGGHLREHIIYGGQWNLGFRQAWDAPTWGYTISNLRLVSGRFGFSNSADIAAFLDYGNGRLGVWVFPGYSPGTPSLAIDVPTWGVPIVSSRFTSGDLNNDSYTDIAVFTDMGGGRLREHIIYGGRWNYGLQQVWDAPTWGYPISNMRLTP